ncbi:MAG: hypothetical protein C0603_04140 [Denitrovibrio sp.]|nr:MAG: hypothetical protein C0603_04140 [Denitrovibrio sp.]
MDSIVAGNDKKLVTFYTAYYEILGLEIESYCTVSAGVKQAALNPNILNLIIILNSKEDYLVFSKLRVYLNEAKKNIIVIYTNKTLLRLVTSSNIITISHKDNTGDFADLMTKMGICKPYMKENSDEGSHGNVLKYIKLVLTKGNIILTVNNDCAVSVLSALDNDEVSFKDIDCMTKIDPVLHSSLIKMANSTYFSGSYGEIAAVEAALVRVGLQNAKVFLINFINKSLLINKDLIFAKEIEETIITSLKTASLCYVLTDYFNITSKEVMFSVGLLSTLGKLFIYAALSRYLKEEGLLKMDIEEYAKQIADSNYNTISGMLLKKWNFAKNYYVPILNCKTMKDSDHIEETKALHLAENLLHFMETEKLDKSGRDALVITGLNLGKDDLFNIIAKARTHYKSIKSMLL